LYRFPVYPEKPGNNDEEGQPEKHCPGNLPGSAGFFSGLLTGLRFFSAVGFSYRHSPIIQGNWVNPQGLTAPHKNQGTPGNSGCKIQGSGSSAGEYQGLLQDWLKRHLIVTIKRNAAYFF
jgi:hypothetical protein